MTNKIKINLSLETLASTSANALAGLAKRNIPMYQMGDWIVRPIKSVIKEDAKELVTLKLEPYDEDSMQLMLSEYIVWLKSNIMGGLYASDATRQIAKMVLANKAHWNFKKISGVFSSQTIRSDGSVVTDEGYDDATGILFYELPKMPKIPKNPTKKDAAKALKILEGLLSEFQFDDEISFSVALSGVISAVVRPMFPVVPMHCINACMPGSGKSYLIDLIACIVLGHKIAVLSAGKSEEETEKRLFATLVSGQSMISIDNCNGDLYGDALCQVVERTKLLIRILGKTEVVKIDNKSILFATGNNVRFVGDMTRRVLMANLESKAERPELRKFKSNPIDKVLADRGFYIAQVLTIIKAFMASAEYKSGEPLAHLGSFEKWASIVPSSLIWLGKADPLKSIDKVRDADPQRRALVTVLHCLAHLNGTGLEVKAMTSKEIITLSELPDKEKNDIPEGVDLETLKALNEALIHAVGYGNAAVNLNPRTLGLWFARNRGKVVDNMRIAQNEGRNKKPLKWYVEKLPSKS